MDKEQAKQTRGQPGEETDDVELGLTSASSSLGHSASDTSQEKSLKVKYKSSGEGSLGKDEAAPIQPSPEMKPVRRLSQQKSSQKGKDSKHSKRSQRKGGSTTASAETATSNDDDDDDDDDDDEEGGGGGQDGSKIPRLNLEENGAPKVKKDSSLKKTSDSAIDVRKLAEAVSEHGFPSKAGGAGDGSGDQGLGNREGAAQTEGNGDRDRDRDSDSDSDSDERRPLHREYDEGTVGRDMHEANEATILKHTLIRDLFSMFGISGYSSSRSSSFRKNSSGVLIGPQTKGEAKGKGTRKSKGKSKDSLTTSVATAANEKVSPVLPGDNGNGNANANANDNRNGKEGAESKAKENRFGFPNDTNADADADFAAMEDKEKSKHDDDDEVDDEADDDDDDVNDKESSSEDEEEEVVSDSSDEVDSLVGSPSMRAAPTKVPMEMIVIDDSDRPLGRLSLSSLLLASPDILAQYHSKTAGDLMSPLGATSDADEEWEDAVRLFERYPIFVLPVLKGEGIVGVVYASDALKWFQQESTLRIAYLAGMGGGSEMRKYSKSGICYLFSRRGPWLVGLTLINLGTVLIIGSYEEVIEQNIVLASFLPLIVDSGGNIGAQVATTVIAAISARDVSSSDLGWILRKEFLVSVCIATLMGVIGLLMGLIRDSVIVGATIALALICISIVTNFIGVLLPFGATYLKQDPAVSSSPILTSIADFGGVFIFLAFAVLILGLDNKDEAADGET